MFIEHSHFILPKYFANDIIHFFAFWSSNYWWQCQIFIISKRFMQLDCFAFLCIKWNWHGGFSNIDSINWLVFLFSCFYCGRNENPMHISVSVIHKKIQFIVKPVQIEIEPTEISINKYGIWTHIHKKYLIDVLRIVFCCCEWMELNLSKMAFPNKPNEPQLNVWFSVNMTYCIRLNFVINFIHFFLGINNYDFYI